MTTKPPRNCHALKQEVAHKTAATKSRGRTWRNVEAPPPPWYVAQRQGSSSAFNKVHTQVTAWRVLLCTWGFVWFSLFLFVSYRGLGKSQHNFWCYERSKGWHMWQFGNITWPSCSFNYILHWFPFGKDFVHIIDNSASFQKVTIKILTLSLKHQPEQKTPCPERRYVSPCRSSVLWYLFPHRSP